MQEVVTPKGDYGHDLNFTCQDSAGTVYVLTDYTVTLKLWRPATPGTLFLEGECDIDVAASGTCHYTVQDGDFEEAKTYAGELELTETVEEEITKVESMIPVRVIVTESG